MPQQSQEEQQPHVLLQHWLARRVPEPSNEVMKLHCSCHGLTFERLYASPNGAWGIVGAPYSAPIYGWGTLVAEHPDLQDVSAAVRL